MSERRSPQFIPAEAMTLREAARLLRCNPGRISELLAAGKLEAALEHGRCQGCDRHVLLTKTSVKRERRRRMARERRKAQKEAL